MLFIKDLKLFTLTHRQERDQQAKCSQMPKIEHVRSAIPPSLTIDRSIGVSVLCSLAPRTQKANSTEPNGKYYHTLNFIRINL